MMPNIRASAYFYNESLGSSGLPLMYNMSNGDSFGSLNADQKASLRVAATMCKISTRTFILDSGILLKELNVFRILNKVR